MDIYNEAIEKFGVLNQMDKALEELAELQVAIHHFRAGKIRLSEIASEIADVEIICQQLRIIVGNDYVDAEKQYKLKRLRLNIENNNNKNFRQGTQNSVYKCKKRRSGNRNFHNKNYKNLD